VEGQTAGDFGKKGEREQGYLRNFRKLPSMLHFDALFI
jgi:hypothetical protein